MNADSSVAVFWDYENCALPATEPPYMIVNKIRRLAHQYGSVKTFKAYLEYPEQTTLKSIALRSELQSCGVSLIDCPHNGRKDVADKMLMIDMMAWAIDNPAPATIILISGDRDFVYAVSILSLRQYRIVLLAPRSAHGGLKGQADVVYNWPEDFLPELPAVALSEATPPPPSGRERRLSRAIPLALREYPNHQLVPQSAIATPQELPPVRTVTPGSANNLNHAPASPTDGEMNVDLEYPSENNAVVGPPARGAHLGTTPDIAPVSTNIPLEDKLEDSMQQLRALMDTFSRPPQPALTSPSRAPGLSITETPSTSVTVASPLAKPAYPFGSGSSLFGGTSSFNFGLNPHVSPFANNPAAATSSANALPSKPWEEASSSSTLPIRPRSAAPAATATYDDRSGRGVGDDTDHADPAWQTFSRAAAKKRAAHVPAEFRPLVKVLKRQLAAGAARVESSQLGTLLSAEAAPVSAVYERAGVTRLKEYTALAADVGIVTLSRESIDGHNYVALHPVHRRRAVEHVWG